MKLSHRNYRNACDEAFSANMSNPTIFWNPDDGFYVSPSSDLVPNDDLRIGLAYYCLNNGGNRSFSGSRREYRPLATGIRKFYAETPNGSRQNLRDAIRDAINEAEYELERDRWATSGILPAI